MRSLSFETLTLFHFDKDSIIPELLGKEEIEWLNSYHEKVYRSLSPLLPEEVAEWLRDKTAPLEY